MKNIVALGICLAMCNVYAHDMDHTPDQDMSSEMIDTQTRQSDTEEMMYDTTTADQKTYPVSMKNADGEDITIQASIITLEETRVIFNSPEGEEYLATKGLTPDQAFDSIVDLLGQIQNKTITIDGNTTLIGGISFTINDNSYFVKSSEFANVDNDTMVDYATTPDNDSDMNS